MIKLTCLLTFLIFKLVRTAGIQTASVFKCEITTVNGISALPSDIEHSTNCEALDLKCLKVMKAANVPSFSWTHECISTMDASVLEGTKEELVYLLDDSKNISQRVLSHKNQFKQGMNLSGLFA